MMINKILVALDYSKTSEFVFNSALSLAKSTNAAMMLVHVLADNEPGFAVVPSYTYYPVLDDYDYNLYQKRYEDYKQKGIKFLQQKHKEAQAVEITTEFVQLEGHPGRSICELAHNWSADLILIGSRRLTGVKEMFLGSVSNYVTHHAPCSVLIIPAPVEHETETASLDSETTESKNLQTSDR